MIGRGVIYVRADVLVARLRDAAIFHRAAQHYWLRPQAEVAANVRATTIKSRMLTSLRKCCRQGKGPRLSLGENDS